MTEARQATGSTALRVYERALRVRGPLTLRTADGRCTPVPVDRYLSPADAVDLAVLDRRVGPVLDVGCGPGRIAAALHDRGVPALGIDIARVAVAMTQTRGAAAVHGDVFDTVPAEGQWATAVLLDGNIGIGGDPDRLLARLADIVAPDGRIVVEADADRGADARGLVHFVHDGADDGTRFLWATVGARTLRRRAARQGLGCVDEWSARGRTFLVLSRT